MNPIGWCHETWNPVVGCTEDCKDPNGKSYCYARRMAYRRGPFCDHLAPIGREDREWPTLCGQFFPHLHEERLDQPLRWRKPRRIFCGSMCDLWDPNVKQEWRDACYEVMAQCPQHRFLVLTKQPQNVSGNDFDYIDKLPVWPGITVEGKPQERRQFDRLWGRFISAEPLFSSFQLCRDTLWLILGADSRKHNPYLPGEDAFFAMIRQADDLGIPVFVKSNAYKHYPGLPQRQEFPEGLRL